MKIVSSQREADEAIAAGCSELRIISDTTLIFTDVTVRLEVVGCAILYLESFGSSTINLKSRESSTINAESLGSSTINAKSLGSSTINAECGEHVQCTARGRVSVKAKTTTQVRKIGSLPSITGGAVLDVPWPMTPREWCLRHGVPCDDDIVILFKGVNDDFASGWKFSYAPGTIPVAPDWDGGDAECGGGLHFSPRPSAALVFAPNATRFVACPVLLSDLAVTDEPLYPEKIKGRGCCAPVWECDIDGNRIEQKKESEPQTKG